MMTKRNFAFFNFIKLFLSLLSFSACASNFKQVDPNHVVPKNILEKTLNYFSQNQARISNQRFIGIIDFTQHNSKERFYVINLQSGIVKQYLVAHGKNSDPLFSGYATNFSNEIDSNKSSLGFFLTAESYYGEHGLSLRLDGLSTTNSNTRERALVIHPAAYVAPGEKIGRSLGCPAVEPRFHQQIIEDLRDGALILASFE